MGAARTDQGQALRESVPRPSHADWTPSGDRPDPVQATLEAGASRLTELLPLRNARLAANPSAYFRSAGRLMAADLSGTPTIGVRVQTLGEAHLSNFGIFATPDRSAVFDVNDFDDTMPAPWEWDLKRLAVSLEVVLRMRNVPAKVREEAVAGIVQVYRRKVAEFSSWRTLDIWYAQITGAEMVAVMPKSARVSLLRETDRARRKNHLGALNKLTVVVDGQRRFLEDPPILVPVAEGHPDRDEVASALQTYRTSLNDEHRALFDRFRLVDLARRAVTVGNVGTRCWIGLFEGPDHPAGDPLFLQVKQAGPSVLEASLGRSAVGHHGQRIVAGQRQIEAASDVFLGWGTSATGTAYYVRQLWDVRGPLSARRMDLPRVRRFADLCAWMLARAHSRTGDAAMLAGYLGKGAKGGGFDKAVAAFARTYADQVFTDYAAVLQAIADGVLPVPD